PLRADHPLPPLPRWRGRDWEGACGGHGVIALETHSLNKSFGSLAVTQDISLAFEAGLRYAIIGPNGAGKTTYFNLLAGNLRPDGGTIHLADRDITRLDVTSRARIGIARSFQRNNLFPDFTVREN